MACSPAAQNGAAAATIKATSQRGGMKGGTMHHARHATLWLCHSLHARASSIGMTAASGS
jgi:hypothetical protein